VWFWVARQNKVLFYCESRNRELKTRLIYEDRCDELFFTNVNVYHESIKREPKIKSIYECRCDERLQTKTKNLRASHTLGWSLN
jgi:hypothetical protein